MHLSESQLKSWSHAPDPAKLYDIQHLPTTIRNVLRKSLTADHLQYEVYLEGSYANDTHVGFATRPKIVVQINSVFWADRVQLSEHEHALYSSIHKDSEYKFIEFRKDVEKALVAAFGHEAVEDRHTGFHIEADNSFAIIPASQYRLYKKFISYDKEHFIEGIKFFDTRTDTPIIYYPKLHIRNCNAKDLDTNGKFKETIRIFKQIRNYLSNTGYLEKEKAPSYFIESLLYNCSDHCFSGSVTHCMLQSLQYLFDALISGRMSGFISADEQELLVSPTTWDFVDAQHFINLVAEYFLEPGKYEKPGLSA